MSSEILAAKQVGDVSYMVADLSVLYTIIDSESIKQSNSTEYNPRQKSDGHYVSLSRDFTAAALRNNKRWRYGVILDGNKLSERYHVEPFSFPGSVINSGGKFAIKELTSYDDNTYKLVIVNRPAMSVPRVVFNYLEEQILNLPESYKDSHHLVVQEEGIRRVKGRKIDTKYLFNVKHGDGGRILSKFDSLPEYVKYVLTKSAGTNEYEERIWTERNYISIKGCILGLVLPQKEIPDFETDDRKLVVALRDLMDSKMNEYQIVYY